VIEKTCIDGRRLLRQAFDAISALMECHSRVAEAMAAGETVTVEDTELLIRAIGIADTERRRLN
jgi:hypothetical protein